MAQQVYSQVRLFCLCGSGELEDALVLCPAGGDRESCAVCSSRTLCWVGCPHFFCRVYQDLHTKKRDMTLCDTIYRVIQRCSCNSKRNHRRYYNVCHVESFVNRGDGWLNQHGFGGHQHATVQNCSGCQELPRISWSYKALPRIAPCGAMSCGMVHHEGFGLHRLSQIGQSRLVIAQDLLMHDFMIW